MNKTGLKMCAMLLPMALTACSDKNGGGDAKVIEKPEIKIENGMLTPEVLEAFGRISEATPSPDGTKIIFTLTYEDIQENKGNSEIYIMEADGKDMKRLTKTAGSESNLQWIDNGEKIAFLRHDADTDAVQIFSMNPDGSGVKRLSSEKNGIECFKISPDGKHVVFASAIDDYNKNDEELFKDLPKTTGRVVDDLGYKHWDEWVTKIPHPFVAELDGEVKNAKDIMEGEPFECPMRPFGGAESFAWSPDGTKLVYVSRKLKGMEYVFSTDSNLYLYDLANGKTEQLTGEGFPGYDTDPVFSPDGKSLAWLSMPTAKYESDKKRLMVMDMNSRESRDLTANWDYWPEQIAWAKNGASIWFTGYYEGVSPVFTIDVNTCAIDTVATGQFDYVGVNPVADNAAIAMRHSMREPNEIFLVGKGEKEAKQLTSVNKDLIDQLKLGDVRKVIVPTTDGGQMTCWEILPPDFDPNKKYPAILYCQGGPQQAVSQFWSYRWNFMIMAAHGYVIIAPNRHGVPGFGTAWNRQISGDYGGQNMQDYFAATDYIKAQPYVDADHVGADRSKLRRLLCVLACRAQRRPLCSPRGTCRHLQRRGTISRDRGDVVCRLRPRWSVLGQGERHRTAHLCQLAPPLRQQLDRTDAHNRRRTRLPYPRLTGHAGIQRSKNARTRSGDACLPRRKPLGAQTSERDPLAAHILPLPRQTSEKTIRNR